MKKYLLASRLGLQSVTQYKISYLTGLISIFCPLMIQTSLWTALYGKQGYDAVIMGYTYPQILLYSFTATMSGRFISTDVHNRIAEEMKSGMLNTYLMQPVSYPLFRFFVFIGEKLFHFIFNMGILGCVLCLLRGKDLTNPLLAVNVWIFIADSPFALLLNFLMLVNISFIAFWIVEVNRIFGIINILLTIFSGAILPLDIFGKEIVTVLQNFPFFYTTYFLTNILTGTMTAAQLSAGVCKQLVWILLLFVTACFLWRAGMKRYEAVG